MRVHVGSAGQTARPLERTSAFLTFSNRKILDDTPRLPEAARGRPRLVRSGASGTGIQHVVALLCRKQTHFGF